jgi:WD40 repeat protein
MTNFSCTDKMEKNIISLLIFLLVLTNSYCRTGNNFKAYKTNDKRVSDLCFTRNGKVIGITDNQSIKFFFADSATLLADFQGGHRKRILSIDISKDSTLLVSGAKDSTIIVWDLLTGKVKQSLSYQKEMVTSVKISPDSKYIASGGSGGTVYLYRLEQNNIKFKISPGAGLISSVAFSSDGKLLAVAGSVGQVNIYNIDDGSLLTALAGHSGWVRGVCFSKDGKKVVSCGDDSRAVIWDISDILRPRNLTNSKCGNSWLMCADFSEDCQTFVMGNFNGNAIITGMFKTYRIRMGKPVVKVIFKPGEGINLKVAVATMGKGAFLVEASKME